MYYNEKYFIAGLPWICANIWANMKHLFSSDFLIIESGGKKIGKGKRMKSEFRIVEKIMWDRFGQGRAEIGGMGQWWQQRKALGHKISILFASIEPGVISKNFGYFKGQIRNENIYFLVLKFLSRDVHDDEVCIVLYSWKFPLFLPVPSNI